MKRMFKILFLLCITTMLFSCMDRFVVVPKSVTTCSCENDSTRLKILNEFINHKISTTQNVTINANKVKHNDFNNTLHEDFSEFFPKRTVYYVIKKSYIDRLMSKHNSYYSIDYDSYYCTKEEAVDMMNLLNKRGYIHPKESK